MAGLTDFTDLNEDKQLMVLRWRNNDNIRKWMYDSQIISIENHFKFIKNLKNSKKNRYFLVDKDNEDIGVIYFNEIDHDLKSATCGLYADPDLKASGIGTILEDLCIKYAFDILKLTTLKLEVFSDNIRAISLYKKFDFKEVSTKIVNTQKVICMELRNENR